MTGQECGICQGEGRGSKKANVEGEYVQYSELARRSKRYKEQTETNQKTDQGSNIQGPKNE